MAKTAAKLPVKTEAKPVATKGEFWAPFERLRREIDRLFDEFHPLGWRFPFRRFPVGVEMTLPTAAEWQIAPAMDLVEKDDAYEISAELPGMDEKNIEVKLSSGTLTIKGAKTEEQEKKEKEYYISERRYGSFRRCFQIPEDVDADKIEASFAKGVLTVTLPKSAEAKKKEKKISVEAA